MSYEKFLEEYKRRRSVWQLASRWLAFCVFVGVCVVAYCFWPHDHIVSLDISFTGTVMTYAASIFTCLILSLGFVEIVLRGIESVLEKYYLKPYVIVHVDENILIYGFIRDAARTEFQLKLQRMFPGYEFNTELACETNSSIAMSPIC